MFVMTMTRAIYGWSLMTNPHRVLKSDRNNLTVTHSLAHSLLCSPTACLKQPASYWLAHSFTHAVKIPRSLDVLATNHFTRSLTAQKSRFAEEKKGCTSSTTHLCTHGWITPLLSAPAQKKLVNKVGKAGPAAESFKEY